MATARTVFELTDRVVSAWSHRFLVIASRKFGRVTTCAIRLVRCIWPGNHFIIGRMTGDACLETVRLVADADVAIGIRG